MMKFGTITQQGLTLSSDIGILPAQHSANIQIDFSADPHCFHRDCPLRLDRSRLPFG